MLTVVDRTGTGIEPKYQLADLRNDFYRLLGSGTLKAAAAYGGEEFGCVLGQEMAGYATGELFFAAQSLGFRHSHLDTGAYSWEQKNSGRDVERSVDFLMDDEPGRTFLTSMVACLFARSAYNDEQLAECLAAAGYEKSVVVEGTNIKGSIPRFRMTAVHCSSGSSPSTRSAVTGLHNHAPPAISDESCPGPHPA